MPYYVTYFKRKKARITTLRNLVDELKFNSEIKLRTTSTFITTETTCPPETSAKLAVALGVVNLFNETYNENKAQHFTVFQIPKATGGYRTIKAPSEPMKAGYSMIAHFLQHELKIRTHDCAYAYVPGRSTVQALKKHQENESNWFLKIDITKFFDNCSKELIQTQLNKVFPLNHAPQLVEALAECATLDNELPQGTPLSPLLTNILMVPFDYHLSGLLQSMGFIYTRYADDILISHKESFRFKDIITKVEKIFNDHGYPFILKPEKIRYGNRQGRNWNLGLMLNKDNEITIGHENKHKLKTILYKIENTGELTKNDPAIIGLFSYMKQIEPDYYMGLNNFAIRKYHRSIDDILKD